MTALQFLNVFTAGVAAGGLFVVFVAYTRSLTALSAAEISKLHARFHPPTHRWMQAMTITGALTAIGIAAMEYPAHPARAALLIAGIPGAALQAVLSRFWVVPWSDEMVAWGEHGAPANYRAFVQRWTLLHGWRVVGALEAFVCYAVALSLR